MEAGLRLMVEMGIPEPDARELLVRARGDVSVASHLYFSRASKKASPSASDLKYKTAPSKSPSSAAAAASSASSAASSSAGKSPARNPPISAASFFPIGELLEHVGTGFRGNLLEVKRSAYNVEVALLQDGAIQAWYPLNELRSCNESPPPPPPSEPSAPAYQDEPYDDEAPDYADDEDDDIEVNQHITNVRHVPPVDSPPPPPPPASVAAAQKGGAAVASASTNLAAPRPSGSSSSSASPATSPSLKPMSSGMQNSQQPMLPRSNSSKESLSGPLTTTARAPTLIPSSNATAVESLDVGTFLDVRDSVGKWLEAEIIRANALENRVFVHFVRWDSKWDEWIDTKEERFRFAPFHKYSAGLPTNKFDKLDKVWVFPHAVGDWRLGFIKRVDGPQVQVQYETNGKRFQYWFHVESEEIYGEFEPAKPRVAQYLDKSADGRWEKGQFIEVLDTVKKWLPAVILNIRFDNSVLVHYDGWSSRWDEWINLDVDKDRIRALGSNLAPSEVEKAKQAVEEKFRSDMKGIGLAIVDMEKDGNCMFRCAAHQIYNDANRHEQVRTAVYDYMANNREFFSLFVDMDFDAYLARQRKKHEWGDHVELMALRELYNKNIIVYKPETLDREPSLDIVRAPGFEFGVMRFSFHGQNHYNSVVKLNEKFKPLEDGAKDPVRIADIRKAEWAGVKGSSSSSAPASASASSLMASVKFDALFDRISKTYASPASPASMSVTDSANLISDILKSAFECMKEVLQAAKEPLRIESLTKAYDDAKSSITEWAVLLNMSAAKDMVSLAEARKVLLSALSTKILQALVRGQ